jgi:hypothetical protein
MRRSIETVASLKTAEFRLWPFASFPDEFALIRVSRECRRYDKNQPEHRQLQTGHSFLLGLIGGQTCVRQRGGTVNG